uniref:Uncharacterized protein n=1 Tax=Strigamia maritima TaxID=126957 RepID=T1JKT2_STRMM
MAEKKERKKNEEKFQFQFWKVDFFNLGWSSNVSRNFLIKLSLAWRRSPILVFWMEESIPFKHQIFALIKPREIISDKIQTILILDDVQCFHPCLLSLRPKKTVFDPIFLCFITGYEISCDRIMIEEGATHI